MTKPNQNAGSAETGGEKAAPQPCEEGFEFFVVHRLHRYGLEFGNRIEDLENFMHDVKTEHRKRLANFRRSSQGQTASGGVDGAHEGTTADKSGSREPEKLNNAHKLLREAIRLVLRGGTNAECATFVALAESSLSSSPLEGFGG